MKPKRRILVPVLFVGTGLYLSASGAEITKLQNTNQLDNGASWSGGVVPGASDVMLWNATYTTPGATGTLAAIGSNLSVAGIKVTDVGGTRNAATTMVGYQNTGSAILTIGSGGIDLSVATQAFYAGSRITIGANQTWNIGNANTNASPQGFNNNEDLGFQAPAAGAAFEFGGKKVTTTGVGQISVTSGYTMSNGTLEVGNNLFVIQGGTNRLTTVNNTLGITVNTGSALRLQSNSGAITCNAPITVNGALNLLSNNGTQAVSVTGPITLATGSTLNVAHTQAGPVTISGAVSASGAVTLTDSGGSTRVTEYTGNITTSGTITYANTATVTGTLTNWKGNNFGITGTVAVNGASGTRALRLGSATAGSAAATWNVASGNTLQIDGVSVDLGVLTGSGTVTNSSTTAAATINVGSGLFSGVISDGTMATNVTKTGTGTLTLTGANAYTGATAVNQGKLYVSTSTTGASAVTIADGSTFGVNLSAASDDTPLASLTAGSATGCTFAINNGVFANPTTAPVAIAGALTVNAPTTVELLGSGFTAGTFPLISVGSIGGTAGFAGLTLILPPHVAGSLVNNTSVETGSGTLDVNITSVEGIRWNGGVNQDWDIDPVGDGSAGTLNWKTTVTNADSRFLQGAGGTDSALFDDLAAGTGDVTVNLTTTLTPVTMMVNNGTRNYKFAGSGALSGQCSLVKDGAADLMLANTTGNSYTGGTTITAGSLTLGDGTTAGAGVVAGNIANEGTLVFNRPDDHDFSNVLSGSGSLAKNQANTVTFTTTPAITGGIAINGGKLKFANGGTLTGVVSGTGQLEASAGTLTLAGAGSNTLSGDTILSGGVLKLQKDIGASAVGGNVYVTGAGNLQILNNEQIPDTADLHILGTSGDPIVNSTGSETIHNVLVNTSNGTTGQLVMKNTFTVTGTATLQSGIMGAGSGSIANLNAVVISSPLNTILRVAGNSAATTMNIGAGGVTAVGGDWQIKFGTTDNSAIVNLGGDVTTTGDFIITNGGYTGANLNVINLTGTRAFNIGAGTTTTVAPDFADDPALTADTEDTFTGNLVKSGDGKLVLNASCTLGHTGATTVSAGTLVLNGSAPNSAPTVSSGATLGGTGTITAAFTLPAGAIVSPGNGNAGTLNFGGDITLDAGSNYAADITGAGVCDKLATATGTLAANGAIKVTLTGYAPVANDVFDLADAAGLTGTPSFDFSAAVLPSGLGWDTTQFATDGTIRVKQLGYEAFAAVIPNPDDRDPMDDPDGDGIPNVLEYALGGDPVTASTAVLPKSSINAEGKLVLTFGRRDVSETDTTQTIEIGTDLASWPTVVPITPTGTLPAGVTVDVQENGESDDLITVTIDKGSDAVKFARFKAVK